MKLEFGENHTLKATQTATKVLNEIVDVVLAYRPKPKGNKAKQREQEQKKIEKEDRKRKG